MNAVIQILRKVDGFIKKNLAIELKQQGHYLTGALERSIQGTIQDITNGVWLQGDMVGYGFIIDAGTKPEKIPYRENSGAKSSKYISALINYFKLKSFSEKEAKGIAFATAKVQKREGMPTRGSYAYSKNNERKIFIERTANAISYSVDNMVSTEMDSAFEKIFNKQQSEII